jgi:hypothetical protein
MGAVTLHVPRGVLHIGRTTKTGYVTLCGREIPEHFMLTVFSTDVDRTKSWLYLEKCTTCKRKLLQLITTESVARNANNSNRQESTSQASRGVKSGRNGMDDVVRHTASGSSTRFNPPVYFTEP